jgi:gp16 family phage-associated protein
MPQEPKMTPEMFKASLRQRGITIAQWSADHGYTPLEVYRVLEGVNKGNFGKGHEILVAAGIKPRLDSKAA